MVFSSLVLAASAALSPLDMRWTFGAHEPYTMYRRIGRHTTGDIDGNARWVRPWLNWWDENAPAAMEEMGFNWCHSRFYKGMGWNEERKDFPNVRKFVANCHRHGVKVLAYVQFGTLYPEPMKLEIPELESWASFGQTGEFNHYFGAAYFRWMPCPTCGPWLEYLKKMCTIALTEGGFDGIMFDNLFAKACYCDRCEKTFNAYLQSLPDREECFGFSDLLAVRIPRYENRAAERSKLMQDPVYQAWCNWRVVTLSADMKALYDHIKSVKADAVVSANPSPYRRDNSCVAEMLSLDLCELDRHLDLIVMQSANFPGLRKNGQIGNRVRDMKMASCRDKVCVQLCDDDSRETPETERRYELVLLEDAVFGGVPTDRTSMNPSREPGFLPTARRARRKPVLERFNRLIADNRAAFEAKSYQPVKLFFSPSAVRFSPKMDQALIAAEEILLRNRVPWGYVVSRGAKGLIIPPDCELLVLPGAFNLADAEIAAVLDYAKKGGRLVVTGEAGRYDENSAERFVSPLMEGLAKLNLPTVVLRETVDEIPRAVLGWCYSVPAPRDGGAALMEALAASGWKAPVAFEGLPPHVFAEYKREGDRLYVHLLNYGPEKPVSGARACTGAACRTIPSFDFHTVLTF